MEPEKGACMLLGWGCSFKWVIREGLIEKIIFEQEDEHLKMMRE